MTQDLTMFDNYRADVLFLLVGGNPLPNYVSAQLMTKANADIHLLVTSGVQEVAQRLEKKLQQAMPRATFYLDIVPETGGYEIDCAIVKIMREAEIGNRRVGLNYTGGTKDMAVHVYDKIQDTYPQGAFSYLDAGQCRMGICVGAHPTQWLSTGHTITPTLQDLWELHGLQPKQSRKGPLTARQQPHLPDLCRAIAQVHSTPSGFQQWRDWLNSLVGMAGRLPTWEQYPELEPFIEGLERTSGGSPDAQALARLIGHDDLSSCRSFFKGQWLEEHTLDALLTCQKKIGMQDWAIGLKLQPPPPQDPKEKQAPDFDLDVVGLIGYQLILLSCIATEASDPEAEEDEDTQVAVVQMSTRKKKGAGNRSEAKKHLFEAYTRARQVGGDEAKAVLISCVADPGWLQTEVEQKWDAKKKIKVFGQAHLKNLPAALDAWLRKEYQQ